MPGVIAEGKEKQEGEKVFVYAYFAGHGVTSKSGQCYVLNEVKKRNTKKILFALQVDYGERFLT